LQRAAMKLPKQGAKPTRKGRVAGAGPVGWGSGRLAAAGRRRKVKVSLPALKFMSGDAEDKRPKDR
jgi:hypothetical protein